jgi:hypothetical protein
MQDDPIWGIDLSGSPWPSGRLLAGPGGANVGAPAEIVGTNLREAAGPLLLVGETQDPCRPFGHDWAELQGRLRELGNPIRAQMPERSLVGVAYPRSISPILRQYLPILLGSEPARSRSGLPANSKLVGLEAPVALTLEAIARNQISVPGTYAVGCGAGSAKEWTAVTVDRFPSSVPAVPRPILRIKLGQTAASPGAIGLELETTRLVAGDDPTASDPGGAVVRLDRLAIAIGAARFARWRAIEFSNPSSNDRRIQAALLPGMPVLSDETIHPLGLIGTNDEGAWFWRRLFEPGTPIPSGRAVLRSNTKPPYVFYLAETVSPEYGSHRWLAQPEWSRAGLRWHSTHFHSDTNAPLSLPRWSLELRDFNDTRRDASSLREEPPPRWSLPTWITRIENDSDTPVNIPPMGN